jgi:hypothetical protein
MTTTNADTIKRVGYALQDAQRQVEYSQERLTNAARSMSERMAELANKVKNEPTAVINSLGELQGRGPDLDRLCAEFESAKDHVKAIKYIIGDEGGN